MKKLLAGLAIVIFSAFGLSDAQAATAKVLAVGGGGGGGGGLDGTNYASGGGGGQVSYNAYVPIAAGEYTVTVGVGGLGQSGQGNNGGNGTDSSLSSLVIGGHGHGGTKSGTTSTGGTSGSGKTGGTGVMNYYGGGGGGDSANGTNGVGGGSSGDIGHGGDGTSNVITGTTSYYGGGGGGGGGSPGARGHGGIGGGGDGAIDGGGQTEGAPNTGGGGGASGGTGSKAGGSGIVIIAYTTSEFSHTGGNSTGTNGSETWVKFTTSGTFTLALLTPTPTNTPTNTPTQTPTNTPTTTPTPTNTPDVVPPGTPLINRFVYDELGRTVEIRGTAEPYSDVYVYDSGTPLGTSPSDGSGHWTYMPGPPIAAGPHSISAKAEDASHNLSAASKYYAVSSPVNAVNASRDAEETHSGSAAMRIENEGSCEFRLAVDAAGPLTVKAWMRKNDVYTGTQPAMTLTGLGIDGTGAATAWMTGGADAWEQLTVTGTPNAQGILTLRVETFSTAVDAKAWVDDLCVSQ